MAFCDGGVRVVVDLLQHLDDGLVGATVERAPQGVHAGGDRGEQVGLARSDEANGRRRAVLTVVGVEDQQHVERLGDDRDRSPSASTGSANIMWRKFST